MINRFEGEYYFLSNYFECPIKYNGFIYGSAEAAFQAQKVTSKQEQAKFVGMTPSQAKRHGRNVKLRKDWEYVKEGIMLDIIRTKFSNPNLAQKLLATGNEQLVEGTTWNDRYWGIDLNTGAGKNMLGNILMRVRYELNGVNR